MGCGFRCIKQAVSLIARLGSGGVGRNRSLSFFYEHFSSGEGCYGDNTPLKDIVIQDHASVVQSINDNR